MKFNKRLAFVLTVIFLLSCLLIGCTPDKEETDETQTLPALDSRSDTGIGGNNPTEPQILQPDSDPVQTQPDGQLTTEPAGNQLGTPDGDGMEVESGYTVEIGSNLGVGGN